MSIAYRFIEFKYRNAHHFSLAPLPGYLPHWNNNRDFNGTLRFGSEAGGSGRGNKEKRRALQLSHLLFLTLQRGTLGGVFKRAIRYKIIL